jgi:GNAT superfamily N-acetyltransferase
MGVRTVRSSRDLRAFIDFPYRHYARDPLWVPPLRREVRSLLSRRHNPFFDHGEAAYFVAERNGEVVGRIAAIDNQLHTETHRDGVGFFGLFECIDDSSVAAELLRAASDWIGRRGLATLRGPVTFSVNQECGLLVAGYDTPPALMMPHNPPYYGRLLQQAEFRKIKDLWVYEVGGPDLDPPVPERISGRMQRIAERSGIRLRPIDMGHLDREAERIRLVFNAAWAENWGFVPLTGGEVGQMVKQLKSIVIPELVPVAEKDGEMIGFALTVPDLNQVLRSNRSGRLLPVLPKLLWSLWRRKFYRLRVLLLGVLPEYRSRGIDAMLWHWIWSRVARNGIRWGEAGWILEDNAAMKNATERMGFRRYKTYRLFDRPT